MQFSLRQSLVRAKQPQSNIFNFHIDADIEFITIYKRCALENGEAGLDGVLALSHHYTTEQVAETVVRKSE